ncbi:hypothetical protein OIU77_023745 [Salix suchowensis]|uniref:Uncharacterized protein n=1 Tax=Salix suchowensis TaxID=1278906 RepID=A0ABQ9C4Y8_9ROSI|nr:hypothetical protein OIU77_023745 [Salix suchowensis]
MFLTMASQLHRKQSLYSAGKFNLIQSSCKKIFLFSLERSLDVSRLFSWTCQYASRMIASFFDLASVYDFHLGGAGLLTSINPCSSTKSSIAAFLIS